MYRPKKIIDYTKVNVVKAWRALVAFKNFIAIDKD